MLSEIPENIEWREETMSFIRWQALRLIVQPCRIKQIEKEWINDERSWRRQMQSVSVIGIQWNAARQTLTGIGEE